MDNGYVDGDGDEENGYHEEAGQIVKRVTIVTIYRKLEQLSKSVSSLCDKTNNIDEVAKQQDHLSKLLDEHLQFCRDFRAEKEKGDLTESLYSQGYNAAKEEMEEEVEKKFKQTMWFWAKIIIPASAVLFGLIYWLFDRLIF